MIFPKMSYSKKDLADLAVIALPPLTKSSAAAAAAVEQILLPVCSDCAVRYRIYSLLLSIWNKQEVSWLLAEPSKNGMERNGTTPSAEPSPPYLSASSRCCSFLLCVCCSVSSDCSANQISATPPLFSIETVSADRPLPTVSFSNYQYVSIMEAFMQQADLDLIRSIHDENLPAAWQALQDGADVNLTPPRPRHLPRSQLLPSHTPLHEACCENRNPAMVRLLLNAGADVGITDQWGRTPIFDACQYGNAVIFRILVNASASTRVTASNGDTLLHDACSSVGERPGTAKPWIVRTLLYAGADSRAANHNGVTPLHNASDSGDPEIVRILLHAGADAGAAE